MRKFFVFFCFFLTTHAFHSEKNDPQTKFQFHPCSIETMVDGEEYFNNLLALINSAQYEILMVGWKIYPLTIIYANETTQITLLDALKSAVARVVFVFVASIYKYS